jgi:hypothetical protein
MTRRRLRRFPIILIGRLRLWGMEKLGAGASLVLAQGYCEEGFDGDD